MKRLRCIVCGEFLWHYRRGKRFCSLRCGRRFQEAQARSHDPKPAAIAKLCAEIRAGWSAKERAKREGQEEWSVPIVKASVSLR